MKDSNKWRHHVERSLKRAGVKVEALPTGQTRIKASNFAMTVSDLCRISYSQLETLCKGWGG